jgi:hypothetical protein
MTHNGRMGLIDRIFGGGKEREGAATTSTQFHESEPDTSDSQPSRNAPRRELVQVILRDTMRKHGIPSDWIECRMLSTVSRSGRKGLHVNFVVRQAHDRLVTYIFAFQDSFERELARFEPRAREWLLSIAWEFQGFNVAEMPEPPTWTASGPVPLDLPADGLDDESSKTDEDVQRDLQALFAIRDAAMADTAKPKPKSKSKPRARWERDPDQRDFEPTQPFEDTKNPGA